MLLDTIKEIEQLKMKNEDVGRKIILHINAEKRKVLSEVKNEFINFFREKDFKITEPNGLILASYGSYKISLTIPSADAVFLGAFSVVHINIDGTLKKNYTVPIVEINRSNGANIRTINIPKTEIEKLKQEKANLLSKFEELQNRLTNLNNFRLGFTYYDTDERKKNPHIVISSMPYSTFKEILPLLF